MQIKRIYLDEAHSVIKLFDQYRVFYGRESNVNGAKRFIRDRLENNESVIFAAFYESEQILLPVGFTQLYPQYSSIRMARDWILNDLFVVPIFQSKGIGSSLIKTAINFAMDKNAQILQLETAVDNYKAQNLYESFGFKKQSNDENYFLYKISLISQGQV